MRIAQVAPLYESVPPKLYGGTERVVDYLTEELVRRGHDVTLYATGDSETQAHLIPCAPAGLRLAGHTTDPIALHLAMLERVTQDAPSYDLIHYHTDYLHFPYCRRHSTPHITTLHGRLDIPELVPLYREYWDMPLVSISDAQRRPLHWANWRATVYHGLPLDCAQVTEMPGEYLAFLGRLSPEKRPDRAIEIARMSGYPLKIMGKIDSRDRAYYRSIVRPLLMNVDVEFIGEGGDTEKFALLAGALALLFPIDWPEPFGLVQIEAMAVGTPVIAFANGSVPEIVEHGVTGFITTSVEEAAQFVDQAASLDRLRIRRAFEERFSVNRMVDTYEQVYRQLVADRETEGLPEHYARARPIQVVRSPSRSRAVER